MVKLTDAALLADLVGRLDVDPPEKLNADVIYKALVEHRKASDAWIKYYFISAALLVMAAAGAIVDLSLLGWKIKPEFFAPTGLMYFSVCTLSYTNYELKNRLFKTFFGSLLAEAGETSRVETLLRYPLAFYGASYIAREFRPSGTTLGGRQILGMLPTTMFVLLGWCIAVFGLMLLLLYSLFVTATSPDLPLFVTAATFLVFVGSMTVSAHLLRNPKRGFIYEVRRQR